MGGTGKGEEKRKSVSIGMGPISRSIWVPEAFRPKYYSMGDIFLSMYLRSHNPLIMHGVTFENIFLFMLDFAYVCDFLWEY